MFVTACIDTSEDPSVLVSALVWLFQATTEQLLFASLLMYRFKCSPKIVPTMLRVGAAQALIVKMASIVYILWWWSKHQIHHHSPLEIAFSVILVVSMAALSGIQFYGSWVVWILARSYMSKYFANQPEGISSAVVFGRQAESQTTHGGIDVKGSNNSSEESLGYASNVV
ncbi:hypothetical protein RQP46_001490 [Phenoliferia psychrophenolica]